MKKLLVVGLVMLMLLGMNVSVFAQDGEKDIVDTAIEADGFDTLVDAVVAADLVDALKTEGPYTVFAPTDEAFAALPDGVLDSLLEDTDSLKEVLLYHVVSGEVMAADVIELDGEKVGTLQGQDVNIKVEDGEVFINDAQVITTDISCSNGVIHVIDTVLVPDLEEEEDELPVTGASSAVILAGLLLTGAGVSLLKFRR